MSEQEEQVRSSDGRFVDCPDCAKRFRVDSEAEMVHCPRCGMSIDVRSNGPRETAVGLRSNEETRRATASAGVKAICVLWLLGALLSIVVGISIAGLGFDAGSGLVGFLGLLQVGLGVAQFIAVFGLWRLRQWAWRTAVALLWIGLIFRGISLLTGDLTQILGVILSIAFLVFFYRRRDDFDP